MITLSTILGIVLGYHLNIQTVTVLTSFSISISFLAILWQRSKRIFSKSYTFTITTILVFILFGVALVKIHHPAHSTNHYSNQIDTRDIQENHIGIQFYIKERLKSTSYYQKYIVSITLLDSKIVEGNVLLLIPKKDITKTLDIGNTYNTLTKLKPIPKSLNPYQFDYAKHLSKQYIFHQIIVQKSQLINTNRVKWSVFRFADQIRKHINYRLGQYSFTNEQLTIINALLLGQRQDIDQDTFNNYRDAGAIHILAVSGLHVGILLLLLNIVLKPLDLFLRKGKIIKVIISIIVLWCFATITGASPSVLRAVTMFSFLAIGIQIRSKTSIYNSLFISMFLLLCFNPLILLSVGFQLSYLAVFAIVWIQPVLTERYHPKFYITKKLWETFTVTIAAQLGLLPLTLFYFHQFPGLFFVSNLIIIPFLGGILGLGILIILLASIGVLPQFIATMYGNCIDFMNIIIGWIAQQEAFLFTNIPFSWMKLIVLSTTIILSILIFKKYKKMTVRLLGTSMVLMSTLVVYEKHIASNVQELIIFHNMGNTTFGVIENQRLQVYSKSIVSTKVQGFLFNNYLAQNHAKIDSTYALKNIYQFKKQVILIIDSTSIYTIKKLRPDIILLSNSPNIHLDRVIDSLHPKKIIADGSNYKSAIDQWEINCRKRKIPFHRTDKKGAYILK